MSAGAIGDRSQIAQWHGLKHICYSPWLVPCVHRSCAASLHPPLPFHVLSSFPKPSCSFSPGIPGLQKLKQGKSEAEQVLAKSWACSPNAGSFFLSTLGLWHSQAAQMLAGCFCCSESSTEPFGLTWAVCGSLACRGLAP